MTKLTIERLDKLQDNLLQFQDSYSDPADKENYDIFVDALHMLDEFKAAKEKILAYEQAADRPVGEIFRCSGNKTLRWWNDVPDGTVLYAAPVLPKQPETQFDEIALDTAREIMRDVIQRHVIGSECQLLARIQCLINDVLCNVAAPAQPVIPERLDAQDLELYIDMLENSDSDDEDGELNNTQLIMWLKELQRRRTLPAQPVSEPYKLPQGYALVPCKLTAENGAKSCMIGKFIEQTEISCPECFGDDECETCDGSGTIEVSAHVSWTTIKDIWAKGIEHFSAAPAQESE